MIDSISYGDIKHIKELIVEGNTERAIEQLTMIQDQIFIDNEAHTFGITVLGITVWIILNVWGYQIPNDYYYSASYDSSLLSVAIGCITSSVFTIGVGLFASAFMGVIFYGIGKQAYLSYVNSNYGYLDREEWIKQTNKRKMLLYAGAILVAVFLMAWHYYSYVSG
ncbi:MAG: hypothetical protein GX808_12635 [Syntrophomonadaceae bacterium]|jgi:hypothetical protein|nr:hypothetical protein [Syntrophomonadaceae bacterium]